MKRLAILSISAATLACAATLHATTVGLDTDPMGTAWDRNATGTGFTLWDTFPGTPGGPTTFTDDAPDSSFGISSLALSATNGGMLTGGGDRIYLGGNPSQWTISGTTTFDVNGAVLQLKQYQYTTEALESLYSPTLNGLAFDNISISLVGEGANTQRIISWYWGASLTGTVNSLNFSLGSDVGTHSSIDALSIDVGPAAVTPVPEPSSIALIGGTGVLLLLRRRRFSATA